MLVLSVPGPCLIGSAEASAAAEKLAIPYSCAKTGSTVTVAHSIMVDLDIVGSRTSQVVELCENERWRDRGGACLPLEVHKFELSCGGRRVAWPDVAAAISRRARLQLKIADRRAVAGPYGAAEARSVVCHVEPPDRERAVQKRGEGGRGGTQRSGGAGSGNGASDGRLTLLCRDRVAGIEPTRIELPKGFAPVAETGWIQTVVPLVSSKDGDAVGPPPVPVMREPVRSDVDTAALPDITPSVIAAVVARRASLDMWIDPAASADEADESDAYSRATAPAPPHVAPPRLIAAVAASDPPPAGNDITPARPDPPRERIPVATADLVVQLPASSDVATSFAGGSSSTTALITAFVVGLLACLSLAASLRRWFERPRVRALPAATFVARLTASAGLTSGLDMLRRGSAAAVFSTKLPAEVTNAAAVIEAMIADTRARLTKLDRPGALTEILQGELRALDARLATLRAGAAEAADASDAARKLAPAFRNLVRDLERIGRIVDGAVVSLGKVGDTARNRLPATRAEAFALLGLNPDAPEGTLKKVADGLRMSWHPDHARDEADRRTREDRIKAINAAVDLINGKRSMA